jgi:hypothetical protein
VSVLDKVRRWIDGDSAETVLEEAARDAQIKPRSIAEEFIVKIARSVEEVMQREMVPLPQGTTLIPTEYIVFLSEGDDREWQGAKRKGLEQGLYHILAERAREISGKKKLETQSFAIELRVDGTLDQGEIRIQHGWDEQSTGNTRLEARQKPAPLAPPQQKVAAPVIPAPQFQPPPVAPIAQPQYQQPPVQQAQAPQAIIQPIQPPATVPQFAVPQTDEGEVMTSVAPRSQALYHLEIWRDGVRQNQIPVYTNEISIGRGSRSRPVDIALPGDPEISRRHATIFLDNQGQMTLMSEGRNATVVSNREVPLGQRVRIAMGEPIGIGAYLLRVQPR